MRLFNLHRGNRFATLRVGRLTVCLAWPLLFRRPTWLAPFFHAGRAGGTWVVRAGGLVVVWQGRG